MVPISEWSKLDRNPDRWSTTQEWCYIPRLFASEHDADTPHRIAVGICADPLDHHRNPYAREK